MKIRNGFVSNSSSSSYIVKIRDTYWDEFCDIVAANDGGFQFGQEIMIRQIKEILNDTARTNRRLASDDGKLIEMFKEMDEAWVTRLNGFLDKLSADKISNVSLIEIALDFHGIRHVESHKDIVELMYITSMHNSFDEGMPLLLKEIVLMFLFDSKKKIECERDDHAM